MSSANRGRARNKDDLYETPYWLIEAEVPRIKQILTDAYNMDGRQPTIWEPCAGNGRIVRVLKHFFPGVEIIATDIGEFDDLDEVIDFLECEAPIQGSHYDLIISNPPFFLAQEIIQHAQTQIQPRGSVLMLERLNFFGTKKREPWLGNDMPNSDISPRRASFLPTGQCDSIEYAWLEFQSKYAAEIMPHSYGRNTLMDTMMCSGCGEVHYDKACKSCDYAYCKACLPDHDCKRNLFGNDSLWYCFNHPEEPMLMACKAKGCSLPFCGPCWEEHHNEEGKPICQEVHSAES